MGLVSVWPEPWRKILALTDGQHVPAVSLPCLVGCEAVATKDGGAVFGAACLEQLEGLGLLGSRGTAG